MSGASVPTFRCGHPHSEANTLLTRGRPGTVRERCRACSRAYLRKHRAKRRSVTRATRARAASQVRAQARGLAPDDPRHSTPTGYQYWGCRRSDCGCREAWLAQKRVDYLRKKAKELGVLPRDRNWARGAVSLDALAEARFGLDRVNVGSEWDDPTGEEAVA